MDIALGCGWIQQPCHAEPSPFEGRGIQASVSVAAAIFFRPFLLKEKDQKFKADIIGPNTQSGRFPAMSAMACAPSPVKVWRSRTRRPLLSLPFLTARSRPLPSWRTGIRHPLCDREKR